MANYVGDSGNNDLVGTRANDTFDISQGGDDTVKAGGGSDIISAGGALTAADHINGGGGNDELILDGDYSTGLVFADSTMRNIEHLQLDGDFGYDLTLADGNVAAGKTLTLSHTGSGAFVFDGAAETDGAYAISDFGSGLTTLIGGAGDDVFNIYEDLHGEQLPAADHFDGGGGVNRLAITLSGDMTLAFGADQIQNIQQLDISDNDGNVDVVMADGNVAAGGSLQVGLGADNAHFDGSAELDGAYDIKAADGFDVIIAGAGDDTITGGFGGGIPAYESITGGGGADLITGGGSGGNTYVYLQLSDSLPSAPDLITNLDDTDKIDLSAIDANSHKGGNQAFHLVAQLDHHRGEIALSYDAGTGTSTLVADVNGDGQADLTILISGDQTGFTNFIL